MADARPDSSADPRSPRPWEVLSRAVVLERPPWLAVHQERIRLPSGRILEDFYRVALPEFVSIAAFTPDRQLVMLSGYKHGLGQVTLLVPGGYIDPGEDPITSARRELLEETGFQASDWRELGNFVLDSNRQCGRAHLFLARDAVQVREAAADDTEEVVVKLFPAAQIIQSLQNGDIALLPSAAVLALALLIERGHATR